MKRPTRHAGLLAAALVLAALLGTACTTRVIDSGGRVAMDSVTASGSGTVHAAPDQADMSFGVTRSNSNAKAALDAASATATQIASALEKAGLDKKDIQTQNVSVYPEYGNSTSSKPTITGYTANITVQATVRDIGKLGDVINAANSAGSDSIGGPSFTLSDDSALRGQAIGKAVADARVRAEAMAKAAGKTVGDVLSISESSVSVPGPVYGRSATDSAKGGVPISPGELDVTAEVTVVYELN